MGSPVNNSRTVMVGDNLNSAIASTAIEELIQDASPQLGADLDCNGYDIQFDDGTGIEDDSGNKTLLFGKTVSATIYAKITNNATGTTGPLLEAAGETNVDLRLAAAGTGDIKITTGGLRVTSDNESISVGAGNDLALAHDGSNSTITGGVGKITVTPAAGSVLELDNSNATVDNGSVQVTGDLDVDNISIDGNTVSSTSGDLQLKAVSGSSVTFQDDADATKQLTLDFATIGSGAERTWTFPNSDGTFGSTLITPTFDVSVGVTAATGSSQGDGAITSTFVEIATVGSTGDAVTLPSAAAGKIVIIANNGANSADVFPASGDKIDGGSANAALALAAGSNRIHICQDGTDWDTIQGAGAGSLSNISEDGSPQLGADLDCNGNDITSASNADVDINPHGTGNVVLKTDLVSVGGGSEVGHVSSNGAYDLKLDTNSSTNSSSIVITDAANGDIDFTCNGTGIINFNDRADYPQVAITSSSNATAWDAQAAPNAYHLTTENTTIGVPSNPATGAFISLNIKYGGSHTMAFNTVFEFAASTAPTFTSTLNKVDHLVFRYNGACWHEMGRNLNMAIS